ncbi:MAG: hypothetical protein RL653_817 [Pseudomonadota bacterium]
MKLLCPACERLGEPSSLRLESGCVVATCGRCGAKGSLGVLAPIPLDALPPPPGAAVPAPAPVPVAPVVAPLRAVEGSPVSLVKGPSAVSPASPAAPSPEEDPYEVPAGRCPKCVAVRPEAAVNCAQCGLVFTNFAADEHRLKPGLDRAWRQLVQRWEDPALHDKLLQRAYTEQALPQVARLYQLRIARNEADTMARRGREELLRRAMATATVAARPDAQKPPVNRKALWLTLIGGTVLMLALLFAVVSLQRSAG